VGFMDKVKAATQDVAAQAKSATAGAQSKLEQAQLKKKMDESARQLGYLIYKERTQGTPSGAEADAHVSDIAGYEAAIAAENAKLESAQPAPPGPASQPPPPMAPDQPITPPPSTPASQPPPEDFRL
jgi:hypothetical protein